MQAQFEDCRNHARQAMKLANNSARAAFEAECMGMVAQTMLTEDRAQALQLTKEALQLGRETGMTYCGPMLLAMVARLTSSAPERAEHWRKAKSCSRPAA